jgi:valyl-tRNA synthetase
MSIYKLVWDDFCSWYLEIIKPSFGLPIDNITYRNTLLFLEKCLIVLHPFMPFISEEIWSGIKNSDDNPLIIKNWPKSKKIDNTLLKDFSHISNLVSGIRKYRNENGISYKDKIELFSLHKIKSNNKSIVLKLANTEIIGDFSNKDLNADSLIIDSNEYFINNFSNSKSDIKKINEDLKHNKAFLKSVQSKLKNKRFIENAPDNVVNNEKKKEADIKIKIKMLELKLKK